jgi:sorbitol-specific phosphotransferase system component IIC
MEGRLRFFEFVPLWLLPLAGVLALALFPLGGSVSLGILYGLGVGLLDLWLMFTGMIRIYGQEKGKGLIRLAVIQSYLARYLLLGFLLWFSLRMEMVDFFAAAGGLILPRLVIWGRSSFEGVRDG